MNYSTYRKCSAPFCCVDDSAGFFKLFIFPCNEEIRNQWQSRRMLPGSKFIEGPDMYLCEVHFDDNCWNEGDTEKELLKNAIPSIFQHSSPMDYMDRVYKKVNLSELIDEEGQRGLEVLEKIKAEGVAADVQVINELIECGNLLVTSALQTARIKLTSDHILSYKKENEVLSLEVEELQHKLKSSKQS